MPFVPSRSLLWLASLPLLATLLGLLDARFQRLTLAIDLGIALLALLDCFAGAQPAKSTWNGARRT